MILCIGGYFLYTYHKSPICPDDYATDDAGSAEYLEATDKWTNEFFDVNPDATMSDWAEARHQFWIVNRCTKALERYDQAKTSESDEITVPTP